MACMYNFGGIFLSGTCMEIVMLLAMHKIYYNTSDNYVCFFIAYAYVCTIIACSDTSSFLHAVECLIHMCPALIDITMTFIY